MRPNGGPRAAPLVLSSVVLLTAGCEAAVVRCLKDRACDGTAIVSCRVTCDRNGNNCQKAYTRLECNVGAVARTCVESAGPACVDVGATCDSATTPPSCNGDATVFCSGGHRDTAPCKTAETCHLGAGWAYCVDKPKVTCDPADYPVCVDARTRRECVGSDATGWVLHTYPCQRECRPGGGGGGGDAGGDAGDEAGDDAGDDGAGDAGVGAFCL